jgi:hypothetical protein
MIGFSYLSANVYNLPLFLPCCMIKQYLFPLPLVPDLPYRG